MQLFIFDGVLAIVEGKYLEKEKEQMISCFLSGKRFSDGDSYVPLASVDIDDEWFKTHYEAQA